MIARRSVISGNRALQIVGEHQSVQFALSVLVGLLTGGSLLLDVPLKWKAACVVAMGFAVLLVVFNTKRVLLFTVTFAVPFYIGKDFFSHPEHIGELYAVGFGLTDAIVVGLLVLYLGRLVIRQAEIRLFPFTTIPALAWLVASAFAVVNARAIEVAAIQMITTGKLFLLYFVIANSVKDETDAKWPVGGSLLGVLCQALLGSYQGIAERPLGLSFLGEASQVFQMEIGQSLAYRPQGTIGHPNGYAMYLSATMPFPLALLFSKVRGLYKALAVIALGLGALGLIFSLSRGGWIGFVVVIITVLMLAVRRRQLKLHTALLMVGTTCLILLALTLSQRDLIVSRLTSDDRGSARSRIVLAKGALAIIQDHPLSGVGLNNYTFFMPQYDRASFEAWRGPAVVHNVFLLIFAETGLIGLVAFLWFLASLLIQAWRLVSRALNDTLWMTGVGILSAYIVLTLHNMVDYGLLASLQLFTQFWLLAGITAGLSRCIGYK